MLLNIVELKNGVNIMIILF